MLPALVEMLGPHLPLKIKPFGGPDTHLVFKTVTNAEQAQVVTGVNAPA
jgi:hypothetical protein